MQTMEQCLALYQNMLSFLRTSLGVKIRFEVDVEYFLLHELAHIWQFENTIRDDNKKLVEGFACWVESQLARERDDQDWITRLLEDQNPIYGDGFRFFHKLEQKYEKKIIPAVYKQLVR